jgi:hypothetical protein
MATKPEVDVYVQEQWRKLRLAGDWRQTAEEFYVWGEKQFWRTHKTWQSICDGFIERARERMARRREQATAGPKDSCSVLVCTLCWKVHDAHNEDRAVDEQLPECACVMRTQEDHRLWQLLRACQDLVLLTFCGRRVGLATVLERIGHVRDRALAGECGEEYRRKTAPWFEAIGGGHAEQSAA